MEVMNNAEIGVNYSKPKREIVGIGDIQAPIVQKENLKQIKVLEPQIEKISNSNNSTLQEKGSYFTSKFRTINKEVRNEVKNFIDKKSAKGQMSDEILNEKIKDKKYEKDERNYEFTNSIKEQQKNNKIFEKLRNTDGDIFVISNNARSMQ